MYVRLPLQNPLFVNSFCQLINGPYMAFASDSGAKLCESCWAPPSRTLTGNTLVFAHPDGEIKGFRPFSLSEFCYPPQTWRNSSLEKGPCFRGCSLVFRGSPPGWWITFCLEYQLLVELPSLKPTAKASENRRKISRNPKGKACLPIIGIFRGFGS